MALSNKANNIKKAFPNVLRACLGNVTEACDELNVSRTTFYQWRKDDPEFDALCREIDEVVIDMVESQLHKNIKEGKETSTIFFLKTKGKNRGYVERIETTGKDGEPIEHNHLVTSLSKEQIDAIGRIGRGE